MLRFVKLYAATLVVFFAVDMFWLGLAARGFYQNQIGALLSPRTNWAAAILFYLLFILGILVFVVLPGLKAGTVRAVWPKAAFFGLITYATYDLTNLATLQGWPILMSVVDMLWGTVLSTLVGLASYFIGRRLFPPAA